MGKEIERKFLVNGDFKSEVRNSEHICQGYLSSVPERTVRIRIRGERGYITVKGAGEEGGMSRYEWEMEIPVGDAQELLKLCEPGVIDKVRHLVKVGRHVFEVDEFAGANKGLVMAEVELSAEDEAFVRPPWLGKEVTGDIRYYNSYLSHNGVSPTAVSASTSEISTTETAEATASAAERTEVIATAAKASEKNGRKAADAAAGSTIAASGVTVPPPYK